VFWVPDRVTSGATDAGLIATEIVAQITLYIISKKNENIFLDKQ
jgi:hypothetical protein